MRYLKGKYIGFTGCLLLTVLLLCGCRSESDLVITGGEPEISESEISDSEIPDPGQSRRACMNFPQVPVCLRRFNRPAE